MTTTVAKTLPMLSALRRHVALCAVATVGLVGCLDDSPVATTVPSVRATLSANIIGAVVGGTVDIRVGYRRSRQEFVSLRSSPERVQVAPATTVVLPVTVDIGPCLADPDRLFIEQAGCALVIELTLSDAAGATIDSQTRDSREPVQPGGSVNFGTVTIGVTVSSIVIAPTSVTVVVSEQQSIAATVRDAAGAIVTNVPLEWIAGDATVAQLSGGSGTSASVRGLKIGSTTVTARAGGRTSNSVAVNVVPPAPLIVRQRQGAGCIIVGQTVTLEVDTPPGAIAWSSANASVASVNATTGVVTGVAVGQVVITATSGARTGTATVCVTGPLRVSPTALPLTAGRTGQITASGVTGGVLTYASNSTGIATVDATGLVRGVGVGQATITTTFTAPSGTETATTAVTVSAASIVVSPTSGSAALTRTARFTATAIDANGVTLPPVAVNWAISDATVGSLSAASGAAVDVRALKVGATTVRATLGTLTATAQFNAVAPLAPARLEKVSGDGGVCPTRSTGCTFVVRAVDVNGVPTPGAAIVWTSATQCGPARQTTSDDNGLATTTNICSSMPAGPYTQVATLQTNQQQASFAFTLRGLRISLQSDADFIATFAITNPDAVAAGLSVAFVYKSGPIENYITEYNLNRTTTPALLTFTYASEALPYGFYSFDVVVSTTTPGIGPAVQPFSFFLDYQSGRTKPAILPRVPNHPPAAVRTP